MIMYFYQTNEPLQELLPPPSSIHPFHYMHLRLYFFIAVCEEIQAA